MVDNHIPRALTPGALKAVFIKRITIHTCSYTKHINAVGLLVSDKIFYDFYRRKALEANESRGGAIFDPRDMIDKIYVKLFTKI